MHRTPLAVLLLAAVLSTAPAQRSCCAPRNEVSVTGAGQRSFNTTIAEVRLGVEASGATAVAVQREIAQRVSRLTAFLRLQNVQKLQTTGVQLFAQRNFSTSPPRIVGYTGRNTISFEVPVERAGAVLDGAVENGASQISGIGFKAAPEVTAAARKAAIRDAVRNAKMEAREAVEALGRRLGPARVVNIADTFVPQAKSTLESAQRPQALARASTTPIIGGEQSVTARVSITFVIF